MIRREPLVLLMGIERISQLSDLLVKEKKYPKETPVACVQKACFVEDQRVVIGTLETISKKVEENQLVSPTTIIVGRVVSVLHREQFPLIAEKGMLHSPTASMPVVHDVEHMTYSQEMSSSRESSNSDSDYISTDSEEHEQGSSFSKRFSDSLFTNLKRFSPFRALQSEP